MERFRYDRSSKWLIEHHGDSILRLAGVDDVMAWKAVPSEIVQPRQIPDGVLEVQRQGRTETTLYLIEIETYADRQIDDQIMDDVMLIFQTRRVVPEVVLLVLRPKGQVVVRGEKQVTSPSGRTSVSGRWPVVELWKLPAEEMLKMREPGLVPWISLMEYAGPPDQLLHECREIIDERAKPVELDNILAVSQILASLRYNEQWLFRVFGGKEAMIESPYLDEFIREQVEKRLSLRAAEKLAEELPKRVAEELPKRVAEELPKRVAEELLKRVAEELPKRVAEELPRQLHKRLHLIIENALKNRFGAVPSPMIDSIEKIENDQDLDSLIIWAVTCPDLDSFRQKLAK